MRKWPLLCLRRTITLNWSTICVTLLHTRFWIDVDRRLNWQTDTPIHEWEGLTVDDSITAVVGIDLPERGLRGAIPPELGGLARLPPAELATQ